MLQTQEEFISTWRLFQITSLYVLKKDGFDKSKVSLIYYESLEEEKHSYCGKDANPHWDPSPLYLMRTPACSVHGIVAETRQIHMDYRVLWRKREGTATLSRGEHPNLCLDRLLLLFCAHCTLHWGRSSFTMHRFTLGGYLLQKTKERMLLIT